jgi:hypothetical protein
MVASQEGRMYEGSAETVLCKGANSNLRRGECGKNWRVAQADQFCLVPGGANIFRLKTRMVA